MNGMIAVRWRFSRLAMSLCIVALAAAGNAKAQRRGADSKPRQDERPKIHEQPASSSISSGHAATFRVAACCGWLRYQWSRNGAPIVGATSRSYTTPPETAAATGAQFAVTISNRAGTVTSNPATLTVNSPATSGSTATSSSPTLSPTDSSTSGTAGVLSLSSSSLTFGNVTVGRSGALGVNLTNTGSSNVTIDSFSLAGAGLSITGLSTGQVIAPGQMVTLTVTFAPMGTGNTAGSFTVTSDASDSSLTIALSGTGKSPQVVLSWTASGSSVAGYDIFRATSASGPFVTPLNSSPVAGTQFVDAAVLSGETYFYAVSAVDASGDQSAVSNIATVSIP